MNFIDMFAGIGGFRLGMELAGHICVGHVEIDKYADKSYSAMHDVKEGEFYADDIRGIKSKELPEADCYCGGFPCQAFSIAGRRGGFEDMRGTLIFEVLRLAKARKPQYLFLENVRGLLSHDGGKTFGTILQAMGECGYNAEWQICNSKNFGVPQNRERVFIIGYLRGQCAGKILPIKGADGEVNLEYVGGFKTGKLWLEDGKEKSRNFPQGNRVYDVSGISSTLSSEGGGLGAKTGLYLINKQDGEINPTILREARTDEAKRIRKENMKKGRDYSPRREKQLVSRTDGISNTLTIVQKDNLLACPDNHGVMIKEATKKGYAEACVGDSINFGMPDSKTRRDRVGKGVANTLDTSCNQGVVIKPKHIPGPDDINNTLRKSGHQTPTAKHNFDTIHGGVRIRRLTPRECFRLQGFPDDYFDRAAKVNSDSQLYKQAGNSVTVNVIYAIASKLRS